MAHMHQQHQVQVLVHHMLMLMLLRGPGGHQNLGQQQQQWLAQRGMMLKQVHMQEKEVVCCTLRWRLQMLTLLQLVQGQTQGRG